MARTCSDIKYIILIFFLNHFYYYYYFFFLLCQNTHAMYGLASITYIGGTALHYLSQRNKIWLIIRNSKIKKKRMLHHFASCYVFKSLVYSLSLSLSLSLSNTFPKRFSLDIHNLHSLSSQLTFLSFTLICDHYNNTCTLTILTI